MKKIILVLLSGIFLSGCNRLDQHQPLTNTLIKFDKPKTISQSFVSSRENLNTVMLCIRNPARVLVPLRFELKENGIPIRTLDFSSGNIDNQDCTPFRFEPIPDSLGKRYTFSITSTALEESELSRVSMHVEAHYDSSYPGGTSFLEEDSPLGLDLHFKTLFYQSWRDALQESLSQLVERLGQDPAFLLPLALAIIFLFILLVRRT